MYRLRTLNKLREGGAEEGAEILVEKYYVSTTISAVSFLSLPYSHMHTQSLSPRSVPWSNLISQI